MPRPEWLNYKIMAISDERPKAPRTLLFFAAPVVLGYLLTCTVGQAQRTDGKIQLRANVRTIVLISHFSGRVIPVNFDPRFALTVSIESATPSSNVFAPGAVVTFAIHSPSELFQAEPAIGKAYDFSLYRTTKKGKVRFCCLELSQDALRVPK